MIFLRHLSKAASAVCSRSPLSIVNHGGRILWFVRVAGDDWSVLFNYYSIFLITTKKNIMALLTRLIFTFYLIKSKGHFVTPLKYHTGEI